MQIFIGLWLVILAVVCPQAAADPWCTAPLNDYTDVGTFAWYGKCKLSYTEEICEQPELTASDFSSASGNEILTEKGVLQYNGWGVDLQDLVAVNYKDGRKKGIRAFDFYMMYTPDFVIVVAFVDLGGLCTSQTTWYPLSSSNPAAGAVKQSKIPKPCALDRESIALDATLVDKKKHYMSVEADGDDVLMQLQMEKKMNATMNFVWDGSTVEGQTQFQPLNDKLNEWFVASKRFGYPISGDYSLDGEEYTCVGDGDCIGYMDLGRGDFPYCQNWYWATSCMYITPDGEGADVRFCFNLADGVGIDYRTTDKISPDFVTIEGEHFKLDQTVYSYDDEDLTQAHEFATIDAGDRVFASRYCDLVFTPFGEGATDGIKFVWYYFVQNLIFGEFNGECDIDGRVFTLSDRLGAIEHVRSKF